jgi:hypothetical protein
MKVTLGGAFRDVAALLNASNKPRVAGGDFGKVLANLAPDRPQPLKGTTDLFIKPESTPATSTPKTRFDFARAESIAPEPTRVVPNLPKTETVNPEANGVKTPTVLSARRVNIANSGFPEPTVGKVRELVGEAGKKHGIDPALSMAVIAAESGFNPQAVSSDGHASKGLFQILDSTGKTLMERAEKGDDSLYDPFNPEMNVDLGVSYLRHLHEAFSDRTALNQSLTTTAAANSASLEKLAVAAFNAGEGRVASAQQRAQRAGHDPADFEQVVDYLPDSTKDYVTRVMALKRNFAPQFES